MVLYGGLSCTTSTLGRRSATRSFGSSVRCSIELSDSSQLTGHTFVDIVQPAGWRIFTYILLALLVLFGALSPTRGYYCRLISFFLSSLILPAVSITIRIRRGTFWILHFSLTPYGCLISPNSQVCWLILGMGNFIGESWSL